MAKKRTSKAIEKLNETGRRKGSGSDRRKTTKTVAEDRRKVKRRRQIDPTTCERDYSEPEIEFMHALDEYKRQSGRMFPTCSEILEVIQKLGYRKSEIPNDNKQIGSGACDSIDQIDEIEQLLS